MHARACGLDSSVEGKEVGLDRDFLAELDDLIDPVGLSAEGSHHGGSLGDGLPHIVPCREHLRRRDVTLLRHAASTPRFLDGRRDPLANRLEVSANRGDLLVHLGRLLTHLG
mgnify:CR=1 FL=1